MKKSFYFILSIAVAFSCNTTSTDTTKQTADTLIRPNNILTHEILRDTSIAPANAYNNLFVDSNTVAAYITANNLPESESNGIRNFYNQRNYEFAWFNATGISEEGRNFWNAYTYDKSSAKDTGASKKLVIMMDTLLPSVDTINISPADTIFTNAEIAITRKFLNYFNFRSDINASKLMMQQLLPVKKMDVYALADSLIKDDQSTTDSNNLHRQYSALKRQLVSYMQLAKDSSLDSIPFTGKLKKGATSPALPAIKKRLQVLGYLPVIDTSNTFNDTLEMAVRSYQMALGVKQDGIISDPLVKKINTPLKQLIAQLLVNMNRLLWMPGDITDNYIQVNIPEFMLHAYEGNNKVFDMPVVVGREGTGTMMFAGNMNQVVFSPYWNVPESIVKNEIVPGMQRDPDYIKKHQMEITGTRNNLPVVRQLPGDQNSLGKVKFLFPNSYDIYLHDTNAKYLFSMQKRAFSHGCIRLADAEKMANYVLRNDSTTWTPDKIKEAMNSNEEKFVRVKDPEAVLITYLTVWADSQGKLNFRDDIYGHDAKAMANLFTGL